MTNPPPRHSSREDRMALLREAAKRNRKRELREKVVITTVAVLAILVMLAAGLALGGLVCMLIWNFGVVALVAACGGTVAKIGFWTALFGNLALVTIQGLLKPRQQQG